MWPSKRVPNTFGTPMAVARSNGNRAPMADASWADRPYDCSWSDAEGPVSTASLDVALVPRAPKAMEPSVGSETNGSWTHCPFWLFK